MNIEMIVDEIIRQNGSRLIWERWKIKERIGLGSFCAVYRIEAKGASGRTDVSAMKIEPVIADENIINEESRKSYIEQRRNMVQQESDIMHSLKECPNIVRYEDEKMRELYINGEFIGYYFMLRMELLTNVGSLLRKRNFDCSEKNIIRLAIDIAKGIRAVHNIGSLHRDIKPDNFFVSDSGTYKLGDFNISRAQNVASTIAGTQGYIAPEVYMGGGYDKRADIYSLGISLYQLMNNNLLPFEGDGRTYEEANNMRMRGTFPLEAPNNASANFAAVILKACCPDPGQRYQSIDEMIFHLENMGSGASPETRVLNPNGGRGNYYGGGAGNNYYPHNTHQQPQNTYPPQNPYPPQNTYQNYPQQNPYPPQNTYQNYPPQNPYPVNYPPQNPQPPQNPERQESGGTNTVLIVIVIILFIIVLLFGGYIYFRNKPGKTEESSAVMSVSEENEENPEGEPVWTIEEQTEQPPEVVEEQPQPVETPPTEVTLDAPSISYGVVATKTDPLNLRESPDQDSKSLELIPKGTGLNILGEIGEWYYTEYNGKRGFVKKQYISSSPSINSEYGIVATSQDPLNLRTAPSQDAEVIYKIPLGAGVKILSDEGGWLYVNYTFNDYNSMTAYSYEGYVNKTYVKASLEITSFSDTGCRVNTSGVSGYDTKYVAMGQSVAVITKSIAKNTSLTAKRSCYSYDVMWYEVWGTDGKYYGWVDVAYLDF